MRHAIPKIVWILFGYVSAIVIAQFLVDPKTAYDVQLNHIFEPMSVSHLLGTDDYGRDLFTRIVIGARQTLIVSLLTLMVSVCIGVPLGLISGYLGGKVDTLVMRIVDIGLGIPEFILMIAMASFLTPNIWNLVIAMALLRWMTYTRLTRQIVAGLNRAQYVKMAQLLQVPHWKILTQHMCPHIFSSMLVIAIVDFGKIMLYISALSFLGLGAQPPTPEWGAMLNAGRDYMTSKPLMILAPALCITVTILLFQLTGDALRDYFERERH
ncbi:ABC transporter permease [Staphylococcus agnetis]|uniref:nickel transporter permease n=1 Tax=Staphylococcus agnetis TaxID=985762 RepID=UPI00208E85FF|nr:nickel transporter permease [Staphylococcus agnetis]MCO4345544.1 ABC transporter permease [Staphylococcus agnetis]MCO4355178.1 ABC transporter permease [Staphylococcus agnetis]MCO4359934.1 ABC transporter permease [Staphylococcus agnetis]MCO4363778.1 ABC transporter permease [Staphylococcus agnetis]MCO4371690.1 ABC transporter permease [Staphylococcus agnetis]